MDANEAIGILRGDVSPASVMHRGIAEKMGAEALEAWARAEGATALRMTAQPGQGAAVALYAGLGFEPAEQAFLKVL